MSIDVKEIQLQTCYSESSVWEFKSQLAFSFNSIHNFINQLNWLSFANLRINEDLSTKTFNL